MPQYFYRAVTQEGEERSGILESNDQQSVARQLQSQGLIPLNIDTHQQGLSVPKLLDMRFGKQGLGHTKLLIFTQQLAELMQAGISLDRALEIMTDVSDDPQLTEMIKPIQEGVRRGLAMSKVLEEHPETFARFYISLIQAAEASGDLGTGLSNLADYLQRSKLIRDQILSALIYPLILVIVSAVSLLIILTYVVPQFEQLFDGMNQALPVSTSVVLGVAAALKSYGVWAIIIVVALYLYIRLLFRQENYRLRWDSQKLKLPLFGKLNQGIQTARFSRSLGTLLMGGVPLLNAMNIARETLSNQRMMQAVADAMEHLKEGKHLAAPLMDTGVFPSLAIQMVQVGEETGRLDEMLLKVAALFDRQVNTTIQRLLAILTPVLIVGLGIMIAGIILSILTAIMSINDIPF